jgi:WD40 repeat protein
MKTDDILRASGGNAAPDIFKGLVDEQPYILRHSINPDLKFSSIRSVNLTSDNRYLIITYENDLPRIRVADLEKMEFLNVDYAGHTDSVRKTFLSKDNKWFQTASWDGSSRRYELATGKCTKIFSGFGRSPSCFIDPSEKLLFTGSYDSDYNINYINNGRCWDLTTGNLIRLFKHYKPRVGPGAIDIFYEGGFVYTGSDDGVAYKWTLKDEKPVLEYFSGDGSIRKMAISQNYLAAACSDGLVRVHYKQSGQYYRYFRHFEMDIREVRISKDEKKLWIADENGFVSCFDFKTGERLFSKNIHSLWIWSLCMMNVESLLITGSGDGSIAFLSSDSGQVLARLYNIQNSNDFLIICTADKAFPSGFFYTNNDNLLTVHKEDKASMTTETLNPNDPKRKSYLSKLNLRNLVITRLRNNNNYSSLTENYIKNKMLLEQIDDQKSQRMLNA